MNIKKTIVDKLYSFLGRYFPKSLVSVRYKKKFHKSINWNNPTNLNEKINWLKFNADTSMWTKLADKYLVREYISQLGYAEFLVKLYDKWDTPTEISFDNLPNKFVLKMNNGSGDVIICKDKTLLNREEIIRHFTELFNSTFGITTGEPHYSKITPCIIAEELLDAEKQPIKTSSLIDYKIWCFDGNPECIWTCYNRTKNNVKVGVYDVDWNYHPEYSNYTQYYIAADEIIPKPQSLDKMLDFASKISKGFPQVRIDMYEVQGIPYFGEMTFTSNYAMMEFYTEDYLNYLGTKVKL